MIRRGVGASRPPSLSGRLTDRRSRYGNRERLLQYYPPTHVVYLYEAAIFPGCEPIIWPVEIRSLGLLPLSAGFTLYIPPAYPTLGDQSMYYRMAALQGSAGAST